MIWFSKCLNEDGLILNVNEPGCIIFKIKGVMVCNCIFKSFKMVKEKKNKENLIFNVGTSNYWIVFC